MYIGSSYNVTKRYQTHMSSLNTGNHPVEDMQRDFDEYGEDFTLFILDEINTMDEKDKEYDWMHKYNSIERGVGYNYKDHTTRRKEPNRTIKTKKKPKVTFAKLRGKIAEHYGTNKAFAEALGIERSSLSFKLNNKAPWMREDIEKACILLHIPIEEVYLYFFSE
jgi:group I intron endonuclease